MQSLEGFSRLIQAIYAAAETPALWEQFLKLCCAELAAPAATMGIVLDIHAPVVRVGASVGWDPAHLRTYEAWSTKDPWVPRRLPTSGQVIPSQAICPDGVFERSECYNEFYVKAGVFQGMGGVVDVEGVSQLGIYFHYPKSSPRCENEQLNFLRLLLPHLHQAVRLHRRLRGQELTETAMAQFLDHLPVGFVLLGLDGRVKRMNREAERILRARDGLGQANGKLRAWLSQDQQVLEHLIRSALATTDRRGTSPGGLATIQRRSGKAAYQAVVTPVQAGGQIFDTHRAAAVLLLTDPARSPQTRIAAIQKLFGFTKAEARIAAALLEGRQTGEIAHDLRITQNTLRTHLKSLYSKAGARSQGDLIRLLLRSAASNWEDGTAFTG